MYWLCLPVFLTLPVFDDNSPDITNTLLKTITVNAQKKMADDAKQKRENFVFTLTKTTQQLAPGRSTSVETYRIYDADGRWAKQRVEKINRSDKIIEYKLIGQPEYTKDFLNETFFDRYDYSLDMSSPASGTAVIRGHLCYIVHFAPKPKPPNIAAYDKTYNRISNHLTGIIYIDTISLSTWRIVAHLDSDLVTLGTGIYKFELAVDQNSVQVLNNEIMVPSHIEIDVEYKDRPWHDKVHEKHTIDNYDFGFIIKTSP